MTANQGAEGNQGPQGPPGISAGARRAAVALLFLVLLVGGGNLWATYAQVHAYKASQAREQAQQQAAGVLVEQKLCSTLGAIAALKPPPGSATVNPSRAYEQQLHAVLDRLGPDLGCRL